MNVNGQNQSTLFFRLVASTYIATGSALSFFSGFGYFFATHNHFISWPLGVLFTTFGTLSPALLKPAVKPARPPFLMATLSLLILVTSLWKQDIGLPYLLVLFIFWGSWLFPASEKRGQRLAQSVCLADGFYFKVSLLLQLRVALSLVIGIGIGKAVSILSRSAVWGFHLSPWYWPLLYSRIGSLKQ